LGSKYYKNTIVVGALPRTLLRELQHSRDPDPLLSLVHSSRGEIREYRKRKRREKE